VPHVRIEIVKGRSLEERQQLFQAVHDALMEAFRGVTWRTASRLGATRGQCRSTGPQGYVTGSSRAFHSLAFGYFAGRVPRIARPSSSPWGAPRAFMNAPKLAPCAVRSPEW
jgi:hypothetical protein